MTQDLHRQSLEHMRQRAEKIARLETVAPGTDDRLGLYDRRNDKDSCGVGFIANMKGVKSHQIVADGLTMLCNLTHRGAVGADPKAGDGAGILTQIPHVLFADWAEEVGISLPDPGYYGVGHIFLPRDPALAARIEELMGEICEEEGQVLLGWRDVPVDNSDLGESVKATEPVQRQVFIGRGQKIASEDHFERKLYICRKELSNRTLALGVEGVRSMYVTSMSCRTITYKGIFLAEQLGTYYKDLTDERYTSALALIHQRFATNTFPQWNLAHPYRMVAHNGEINTLRG
ncbi:MAG: glutamate synthase subunit alpha, partial [Rhodobiaceae bacterium]|nr:glutamate synthase subunit alpha [Rhodobiaceae bacterium]